MIKWSVITTHLSSTRNHREACVFISDGNSHFCLWLRCRTAGYLTVKPQLDSCPTHGAKTSKQTPSQSRINLRCEGAQNRCNDHPGVWNHPAGCLYLQPKLLVLSQFLFKAKDRVEVWQDEELKFKCWILVDLHELENVPLTAQTH